MNIEIQDGVLTIREIKELNGTETICEKLKAALPRQLQAIEIDLAQTEFVNSSGLGDLIAVYKLARKRAGKIPIRLLNPSMSVAQFLELTRLHEIFEIMNPVNEAR